ncbi:MAG TPA: DUF305 domain-containing protein [Rubrobacteraceae bacterium]|nr:DUF305 domain-containing protein [Rubrobacteraceae bacterium]
MKSASRRSARRPDPRTLVALIAVLLAATMLVMYIAGRPPGDGSPEAGFARDMSVHHGQAVEMAGIVQLRTKDPKIRSLATDIVLTQQSQIGTMQGWLDVWGLSPTGTEQQMAWMGHPMSGRMPGMASPKEINRLSTLPPEKTDVLFLQLMIPHHKAAIPMAQAVLDRTNQPEVQRLADSIIASQKSEIEAMQAMLKDKNASPAKEDPKMDMKSMDH